MAALNKNETQSLRGIQALVEDIMRNGYDPELAKVDEPINRSTEKIRRAKHIARQLEEARRRLHTLVMMKGYYPK